MKKRIILLGLSVIGLLLIYSVFFHQDSYTINILQVNDERFPALSSDDLNIIKNNVIKLCSDLLDIKIIFKNNDSVDLSHFMAGNNSYNYRFDNDYDIPKSYDLQELIRTVRPVFDALPYKEKLRFLPENVSNNPYDIPSDFYYNFSLTAYNNFNLLINIKDKNGLDIISENYNIGKWCNRIESEDKYNLILFNGWLFDDLYKVQTSYMGLHAFQRGGLAFGCSNRSKTSIGMTSVIGLMPILSDNPVFIKLRGSLSHEDKLSAISYGICHEFGHAILHYNDEYTHNNCIMNPTQNYNFKKWINSVKPCRKKHLKIENF